MPDATCAVGDPASVLLNLPDYRVLGAAIINAQNATESGTVICTVMIDGTVASTNTSSDAYAIAECTASIS